jgi:hypothetical protein
VLLGEEESTSSEQFAVETQNFFCVFMLFFSLKKIETVHFSHFFTSNKMKILKQNTLSVTFCEASL